MSAETQLPSEVSEETNEREASAFRDIAVAWAAFYGTSPKTTLDVVDDFSWTRLVTLVSGAICSPARDAEARMHAAVRAIAFDEQSEQLDAFLLDRILSRHLHRSVQGIRFRVTGNKAGRVKWAVIAGDDADHKWQ